MTSCVIVGKPLSLSGPQVPSSINGEGIGPDALQASFHPTWFHMWFPPLEVRHLCCWNNPKPSLTLAEGGSFMSFLSESNGYSWRLCGATCHRQGSCEVNDSANKKLLVISGWMLRHYCYFKKSISWIRKCHWDKHLFFPQARFQLGKRIMCQLPEGKMGFWYSGT